MPWVQSEEILKTVKKIIIGDIKCPGNIQRGDIYDLVMGKNITGSIISSFLNVLKVNDIDIEAMCPLFFTCFLNKERVTDSIKYVINNPNLMKKRYLFVPLYLKNLHWSLMIVTPQIKTMLYFDSLHKFAEPKELLSLITSFMNFYCLTHRVQQINWDYLFFDEVYQQKADKDCGMFCCLNAYYFLNGY